MKTTDLLIALSRPETDAFWPTDIPADFVAQAQREGLAEQLYYYHSHALADATVLESCKKEYIATLSRNMLFLDQLTDIKTILKECPFILLKGIYLIRYVYADPGLRRFSDIDILVRRDDLPAMDRALLRAGYRTDHEVDFEAIGPDEGLNSVIYRPPERSRAPLHIHWHLFNSILPKYRQANLDIEQVWMRSVTMPDGFLGLSEMDVLMHLSEHALRHSFYRWILIRDIAQTMIHAQEALDIDKFCTLVTKSGLQQAVRCTLILVQKEYPSTVISEILAQWKSTPRGIGEKLFMVLSNRGYRNPELCNLLYCSVQPDFSAKMHYIYRFLFPKRVLLAKAYGKTHQEITFFTYVARLGRGFICFWAK